MHPWNAAFARYCKKIDGDREAVAKAVKASATAVFYWLKGTSLPRADALIRVQEWSKGEVSASLAGAKRRKAKAPAKAA